MRVLVVEDEQKVASFLRRGLEEAGFVVDVASTGYDGEYLAQLNSYDVLVLDLMLPDIDGRQVCRNLRSKGVDTPTLLLTAKSSVEDRILGFDSGANQYLTKPFDFAELVSRLHALSRQTLPPPSQPIVVGDLVIEPVSRTVKRGGQMIDLTTKEFQLVELLATRAGRVVPRTVIIEQVWDIRHDPTSNSVDALVKHLRDKIDRGRSRKLLQTIRGVGYMIKA